MGRLLPAPAAARRAQSVLASVVGGLVVLWPGIGPLLFASCVLLLTSASAAARTEHWLFQSWRLEDLSPGERGGIGRCPWRGSFASQA